MLLAASQNREHLLEDDVVIYPIANPPILMQPFYQLFDRLSPQ